MCQGSGKWSCCSPHVELRRRIVPTMRPEIQDLSFDVRRLLACQSWRGGEPLHRSAVTPGTISRHVSFTETRAIAVKSGGSLRCENDRDNYCRGQKLHDVPPITDF